MFSCCWKNQTPVPLDLDNNIWINNPVNLKDTVKFVPPIQKGVVVKVYDGDTITIVSKLPYPESPLYRFQVRLNGIDCPEIRSDKPSEKECANLAKEEVETLIMNQIITLKNLQTEKYGRILADVYFNELFINKHLLDKRLAVVYDGKTKVGPKDWLEYYTNGTM
jgi:micrococcal nuclease